MEGTRSSGAPAAINGGKLDAEATVHSFCYGLVWRIAEVEGKLFRVDHSRNGALVCSRWSEDRWRYFGRLGRFRAPFFE